MSISSGEVSRRSHADSAGVNCLLWVRKKTGRNQIKLVEINDTVVDPGNIVRQVVGYDLKPSL